ncbi:Alpha-galactosidase alpha-n-acetylgalactosaminidase [Penicillium cosmopolitanum]|uniref:Alpha-galactosidase n=1 Tax=Penicillium cosmopolitanum TaxID=1131564 RepID=A0A9W9SDT5_9EURO|nr:Alpha-galactosidase alpha-n-acetylgalactosaminidase [Penicillium cosmopolitanum]KAJ5376801.1 Alpha-galactosidase alpha-n-acetylgalactosaminidase [Penicillium cosmopolitanum]
MGWNSWNTFKSNFNQSVIENTASLLVSTGLRDAGYNYLVMDEGWQALERDENGRQQPNTTKLPGGVSGIAEFVHKKGLRLGVYSDAGIYDCGFYPGSWGYEELDAATYAEWGVDYLKYDNCGGFEANTESPQIRFAAMRDALRGSGRSIFYSICQWGHQFPWYWADAYCMNIGYAGCSVLTIIRKMRELSPFQKPGAWADMDMLEIGNGNMTLHEQQTHMSFWAALKSPLIIGADLQRLAVESLDVLRNKDIIAISQDSLGKAVEYLPYLSIEKSTQVWAGPLSGGKIVVLVLSELKDVNTVNLSLGDVPGLSSTHSYAARDVWEARNLGRVKGKISLQVAPHQTRVLVLS